MPLHICFEQFDENRFVFVLFFLSNVRNVNWPKNAKILQNFVPIAISKNNCENQKLNKVVVLISSLKIINFIYSSLKHLVVQLDC